MKVFAAFFIISIFAMNACNSETEQKKESPQTKGLGIYDQNPRYWTYDGSPVLLLGGTREDNLFQIESLESHLDSLAAVGGNYIRNTMSSRDPGDLWPFYQQEDGKYDLNRFSEKYFQRFETMLRLTEKRDIIVQIEMWDRFDYARENWLVNPFRPTNNINYDTIESGLSNFYTRHPGRNDNPFFRAVPGLENNQLIFGFQQALVDRILEHSLAYDHVLYCMDNETSAKPEWGAHWAEYIKKKAAEKGKIVFVTEMWDAWDLKDEQHQHTLDHPERYDFADISQNNHNKGQEHWDNLHWVRNYTKDNPRPLNHVKIYGADTGRYGTDRDAIERFWRGLLGGAASIRFHRPDSGLGLSAPVQASLRTARALAKRFDFFSAQPDVESKMIKEREDNEAYLSFISGKQYVLYFPDGGQVDLNLSNDPGSCHIQWVNILESRWNDVESGKGGGWLSLKAPEAGHWLALVEFLP